MITALAGARILTPDEEIERGSVLIEDGVIIAVGPDVSPPPGAEVSELPNLTLAPGFIDLHVHGGGGFSLATTDPEEIRAYARWAATKGVTSFLASVYGETAERAMACLRTVAETAGPVEGGANLLGAHLEGPFLSPKRRGALPRRWLRAPDVALLRRFVGAAAGHLRVLTLAPELRGAGDVLAAVLAEGIVVALGHSDAGYEQARAAFEGGATHVTHAFNAMRPFHHRDPGLLGAALESPQVTLELIADGVHVHPAAARLLARAAGSARVALVSDAVPAAGLTEGSFEIGRRRARLSAGRVLLPDGAIAGSAITMDGVVRNAVSWGLAGLADGVGMASSVPARVLGLDAHKGRIAPGYDADLVALDGELEAVMTWVAGQPVHLRPDTSGWQG